MIFPKFKKLEISDKKYVENFTKNFLPYSDFNFLSLWCWNTKNETMLSELNGNLVVKFNDYLTETPFYSFIGDNEPTNTAKILLEIARLEGLEENLQLVPEHVAMRIKDPLLEVADSRNHFDYIYSISEISTYANIAKYRQLVASFKRKHRHESRILDLTNKANQKEIEKLIEQWVRNKEKRNEAKPDLNEFDNELSALKRMFNVPVKYLGNVRCFGINIDGSLRGFMIDEMTSDAYCTSHFGKIDIAYNGTLQVLMQESASYFSSKGVRFYNDEQDLGLESLRKGKGAYKPVHFLKKYNVAKKKQ